MLSLSMDDNVISYKKSKETVKKKSPKTTKKLALNCDLLNFLIGLVYFGWHLVNPHVQAVQTICANRGVGDV